MTDRRTTATTWQRSDRIAALCGHRRWRTLGGTIALVALGGLTLAGVWLPRLATDGTSRPVSAATVDGVVQAAILGVVASAAIAVLYAVWNGGPLLVLGLAVLPELLGAAATGGLTLHQDLGLALAVAGFATALAVATTGRLHTGTWFPAPYPGILDGLTVATATLLVGLAALLELGEAIGPHAATGILVGWLLWAVGAVVVCIGWTVCVRAMRS